MNNANDTFQLKVEKLIQKPATEVFRAIGEGRLFENCSADHESLQIEFKVGGEYFIQFLNFGMKNRGQFLEIVPHERIVFTWCQDYDSNSTPDTKVVVELKDLGGKTAVTLTHSGFEDKENCDAHTGGWSNGLEDLGQEMAAGKLKFSRRIPMTTDKLTEFCKNPASPFHQPGVNFKVESDDDDQNASWLEVTHEGLISEAAQKTQRAKWDLFLKRMFI